MLELWEKVGDFKAGWKEKKTFILKIGVAWLIMFVPISVCRGPCFTVIITGSSQVYLSNSWHLKFSTDIENWVMRAMESIVVLGRVVLQTSRRVQCSFIDEFPLWHVSGPWSRCCIHTHTHTEQDTKLAEHSPLPSPPVSPPVCPSAEERHQLFWLGASVSQVPSHILLPWVCLPQSVQPSKAYIYYTEREVLWRTTIKTQLSQKY